MLGAKLCSKIAHQRMLLLLTLEWPMASIWICAAWLLEVAAPQPSAKQAC